jgi:hypothetical protein
VLDLLPNAAVKTNLLKINKIPKKNCSSSDLIAFVRQIEEVVSRSLTKDVIRRAVANCPLFQQNTLLQYAPSDQFINSLPPTSENPIKPRGKFPINGRCLTEIQFIEEVEKEKNEKKNKKKPRRK